MMTAPAQTRMEFIRFRRIPSTRKTCGSLTGFPHAGLLHGAPCMGLLAQVQSKMFENVKIAHVRQHFGHPRTVSHRTECIPAPGSRTGFLPPALKYPKRSHSEPRINKNTSRTTQWMPWTTNAKPMFHKSSTHPTPRKLVCQTKLELHLQITTETKN